MLDVLMIVYIVGGGGGINKEYNSNTNFIFERFETIEACKKVKDEMKKMSDAWFYGEDKTKIVPALYSVECVSLNITSDTTTTITNENNPLESKQQKRNITDNFDFD